MEAPQPKTVADLTRVAELVVRDHGASPCAVVGAAIRREGAWRRGYGCFGKLWYADDAPAASLATVFDLASLTKPVTALTGARLQRTGALDRAEPLVAFLPEVAGLASASVPLDLFLSHRAGLEAHQPIFAPAVTGGRVTLAQAIARAASSRRADCAGDPPTEGFAPVYSDMGYLLAGAAISERARVDLDRVLAREVGDELGASLLSARIWRERDARFDERVAPTEVVDFRGGAVRGIVHDENAWAISGDAASGHAGLFGDVASVVDLGVAIADALADRRPSWLSAKDLEPLVRTRPGGSHLAGFDRKSGETPAAGSLFGPRTFGHLGFTGTSLWIDPDAELVGVLLTNRVHPTREHIAIRVARPAAYDAIAREML